MIRIGLPKGVVKHRSEALIERAIGTKLGARQLCASDGRRYEFLLLKHRDIPKLVELGKLNIGITSTEWVAETAAAIKRVKSLDWCDCRISLIVHERSRSVDDPQFSCVTEFPRIAGDFFSKRGRRPSRLDVVSGSSEALVPRVYDATIDCVETGQTLAAHRLVEAYVIMHTKVEVVAPVSGETTVIDWFVDLLETC